MTCNIRDRPISSNADALSTLGFRSWKNTRFIYYPSASSFLLLPASRGRETLGFESWSETMVQRLTYRKRHSYATKSNQHRVVKTPGNFSLPALYSRLSQLRCAVLLARVRLCLTWCGVWLSNVGGKLVYQSTKKRASGPKCPVTGKRIQGVCNIFFSWGFCFSKGIFKMFSFESYVHMIWLN